MNEIINQVNVGNESFYNLCRIADATKYANPISAFKAHNVTIEVEKDDCGNVVKVLSAVGDYDIFKNLN